MLEIFGKQSDRAFQKSLRILKILQKTIKQLQMNSPVFELGWEIYDGKDPTSCEKIQLCTPKKLCCRRPVLFYHDILWLKVLLTQYLTRKPQELIRYHLAESKRVCQLLLPLVLLPSLTLILQAEFFQLLGKLPKSVQFLRTEITKKLILTDQFHYCQTL